MSKARILVVDDEPNFTRLLKRNLEETGVYEVGEENCSTQALVAAQAFQPDLIFLDVMMPHLDGGDVATQIRADAALKDIPIVFLTAIVLADEVKAHQGLIGGFPFIAKSASLEEMLACIAAYLRR